MEQVKNYNEPWTRDGDYIVCGDGAPGIGLEQYDRALACVNALAGRDPAKLEALVEAVRRVSANATDCGDMCAVPSEAIDALDTALAAFEGEAAS